MVEVSCKKFSRAILFSLIWMGWVFLIGIMIPNTGQGASLLQISEKDIGDGSSEIQVQAEGISIARLFDEIETRSGISIEINEESKENLLTVNLRGQDWSRIILEILKDYNQVHLWASPFRLKKVYILNLLDDSGFQTPATGLPESVRTETPKDKVLDKSLAKGLTKSQLRKVASGKHRSPIPYEMFGDPQIRRFLEESGMKTPEDRNNLRLSMKVRKRARKALAAMRRANKK